MGAVSTSAYISVLTRRFIARTWWVGLPLVLLIAWGLYFDWRFAILGFMLMLVVYPMLAVLAIMRHSIDPVLARRSKSSRFDIDGCYLDCYEIVGQEREEPQSGSTDDNDIPIEYRLVERAEIRNVEHDRDRVIFITGRGVRDFIIAPIDLLESRNLSALLNRLDNE